MAVKVFEPQISVVLKKNIGRATVSGNIAASQRFQGSARTVDLTPYIGEFGQVVTRKSVREPCGMFSVVLADKLDLDSMDSLYGVIEPLDVIEIRMARDATLYSGLGTPAGLPLMMRGLVTNVTRGETIGSAGGPQRTVTVSGQDYGKLLQMCQIVYLPNHVLGQDLLTYFKLFVNYGISTDANLDASEFIQQLVEGPVQQFIDNMQTSGGSNGAQSPIVSFAVDATVQNAIVSPFGTNAWAGGSIYDLMRYFGDLFQNELYVEDREDAPYVVYRPMPYKDPTGAWIQPVTNPPIVNPIFDDALVSLNVTRSDAGVYNYYWVDAQQYSMTDPVLFRAAAQQQDVSDFYLHDYPNSTDTLYGLRMLQVQSQQGPRIDGKKQGDYDTGNQNVLDYMIAKRKLLANLNRDNVVFEKGAAELRGDETIKAGTILQINRGGQNGGGLNSEYYVPAVTHTYLPFRTYRTTAELDRGTGFIQRIEEGSGSASPYLTEMAAAGVYA